MMGTESGWVDQYRTHFPRTCDLIVAENIFCCKTWKLIVGGDAGVGNRSRYPTHSLRYNETIKYLIVPSQQVSSTCEIFDGLLWDRNRLIPVWECRLFVQSHIFKQLPKIMKIQRSLRFYDNFNAQHLNDLVTNEYCKILTKNDLELIVSVDFLVARSKKYLNVAQK